MENGSRSPEAVYFVGGSGRNRTTDTRIFRPRKKATKSISFYAALLQTLRLSMAKIQ
jgi:hypothetical protein